MPSITIAPAGGFVVALGPTAVMRPLLKTTVWLGRAGRPVPSTSRTEVIATVPVSTLT